MSSFRTKVSFLAGALLLACSAPAVSQESREFERHYARASLNVERGVRITLGNRTTGRITVNGWDHDVIEAHAVSPRGDEVVIVRRSGIQGNERLFLKADYADLDHAPTLRLQDPPTIEGKSVKVHLELNVPRYTLIELIEVWRSDVDITGVGTLISISGDQSSIVLKRVGAAEVNTRSGNVEIDGVNGLAMVATTSGAIRVSNAGNAVRAISITGPIEIKCARGRVDVANTEAPIELVNIDGDVDAIATNSSVRFTGNLRDGGRYYLKSMSGRVEAMLPANKRGFNATLSSYRGIVETDFTFSAKQAASHTTQNRRLVGRVGNGSAQITLDSFEGLVRLSKIERAGIADCK